ncbi:hypothetical protein SAURM35S_03521 [Streptomyces aurantiogriseus]
MIQPGSATRHDSVPGAVSRRRGVQAEREDGPVVVVGRRGPACGVGPPGAAPAGRGPVMAAKARRKPTTSIPSSAAQVRAAGTVPSATSTRPTGSALSITAARCRPDPGTEDSSPRAMGANSAYSAGTGSSSPYRKAWKPVDAARVTRVDRCGISARSAPPFTAGPRSPSRANRVAAPRPGRAGGVRP